MYLRTFFHLYRCLCCQQHYQGKNRICTICWNKLPWLKHACRQCALEIKYGTILCHQCQYSAVRCLANRSVFAFHYQEPINQMIKAWKFEGGLIYEKFLGQCLIDTIANNTHETLPEAVIAVPISKKRCQERGFNQAIQLSKLLSNHFKIPRYDHVLGCHFQKTHQAMLSAQERAHNLQNIFYLKKTIPLLKHIALVDDVMTTGSTLNAIASLLLEHGVETVDFWGIARVCSK